MRRPRIEEEKHPSISFERENHMTNEEFYDEITAEEKVNDKVEREVTCYVLAAKFLKQSDVINSIGYDQNNIENFLFFWSDLYKFYYQ